jgi:hypothetical protein
MDVKHLLFVLALYTACGTFISLGFLKSSEVGRQYYIYHGLACATLAILAYSSLGPTGLNEALRPYFFVFLICSVLFSLFAGNGRLISNWISSLTYIFGLGCALFVVMRDSLYGNPPSPLHYVGKSPFVVNAVLSMLLIGFATAALLVGHWHLIRPHASYKDMKRITAIFMFMVVLRMAFGTYSLSQAFSGKTDAEIYRYFLSATPGIYLLIRCCWGLLGPLLLSFLVWNLVRVRAPHSATGVLYLTVACILAGETLSQYLALYHGIPL